MPPPGVFKVLPIAVFLRRVSFVIDPELAFLFGNAAPFDFVLNEVSQALAARFPGLEHDSRLLGLKLAAKATSRQAHRVFLW